jgi:hypothetical protein
MSFFDSDIISDQQINRKFKKFIKALNFNPKGCNDIQEVARVIESVRKEMISFDEKFYYIPDSANAFLAKCAQLHQKLLESTIQNK